MAQRLTLTLRNSLDEIPRLADAIEDWCNANGVPMQARLHVTLALDEVVTNAITYGFQPGSQSSDGIALSLARDGADILIVVEDRGRPFDPLSVAAPDTTLALEDRAIGGLGLHFVRQFMTEVGYERADGRNRLTLRKRIDDTPRAPEVAGRTERNGEPT